MADIKDRTSKDGYKPADWFWDSRRKGPSMTGTVVFVITRTLDLPLQWWLLHSGAASGLLNLVFALAVGSAAKQIYWKSFIGDTVVPVPFSLAISAYNTVLNSLNTFLALWSVTSQQSIDQTSLRAFITTCPPALPVGLALYSVGLFTEWYCEIQRKEFKKDPKNKGKPYAGGLFGLARNINYGGYTLWRSGYSMICGGWIWAGLMCTWFASDFIGRAIPSMDAYCEKRYGAQWEQVRRKVPYKLLPWIY